MPLFFDLYKKPARKKGGEMHRKNRLKKKKKYRKRKAKWDGLTEHHLLPRKRKGREKANTVRWARKFHSKWHAVFGHLTPVESIKFIRRITEDGHGWTPKNIKQLRGGIMRKDGAGIVGAGNGGPRWPEDFTQSWEYLFGDMTPDEAIFFLGRVTDPGSRWYPGKIAREKEKVSRDRCR